MASSKDYVEFVMDELSHINGVTYRPMMGEYIIYYMGKVIGGVYDDRFLVKRTPSAEKILSGAPLELPYEGGSKMLLVEDMENRELTEKLFYAMIDELPATIKKKKTLT